MLEVDDRTRKVTTGGFAAGTTAGEAIRIVMQFKAFPVAFQQRVLGRRAFADLSYGSRAETFLRRSLHIGELVGTLWVAGLLSTWAKDLAMGKSPKDLWSDDEGVNLKTVAAALTQSGGLGILGDFLFSESSRHGKSLIETLPGPAIGELVGLADLTMQLKSGEPRWSRAVNQALGATPFVNLWYTRWAANFLLINSLREGVSPGYLARQERRLQDDYGQSFWLPQRAF